MTTTLALGTVEQAEAVLSGRQRYVMVPEVVCQKCDGRGVTMYRTSGGDPSPEPCPAKCCKGRVPDPAWVAAAEPCETCGGKGVKLDPDSVGMAFAAVLNKGKGAGVQHLTCPDCGGSGVPRVTVTVPCANRFCDGGMIRQDDGRGVGYCKLCTNGRMYAGRLRVKGPLLEVVYFAEGLVSWDGIIWVDISDQLPFLATDGPDSLIGAYIAQVEVLK